MSAVLARGIQVLHAEGEERRDHRGGEGLAGLLEDVLDTVPDLCGAMPKNTRLQSYAVLPLPVAFLLPLLRLVGSLQPLSALQRSAVWKGEQLFHATVGARRRRRR